MLNEAQTLLFQAPRLAIYPGVAIALAVLGLNLLGDGLRDLLDPRLAQGALSRAAARGRRTSRVRLQTARGPADAVRGVSFALDRGEPLGLIGESGCGKSMTALALMGLLPEGAQVTGSVRFDGAANWSAWTRRRCASCAATASAWCSRSR